MNVLITGATGFIGSKLVERLTISGDAVSVVVRPGSKLESLKPHLGKIRVATYDGGIDSLLEAFACTSPDRVVHIASLFLANHAAGDVERLVNSNVLSPSQLLEAMSQCGVRLLTNIGTSWQHFENAAYNPVNLYAATKQAFEDILEYYIQAQNFRAVTLKLFDTYGPGDHRPKLFSLLRAAARAGNPLKMSPGEQLLDLLYIDDVIDAIQASFSWPPKATSAERYALSSGSRLSLRRIVGTYEEVTGRKLEIEWGGLPYRQREVMTPWQDAARPPGWEPRISLNEGILRMERDPDIGGLLSDRA